MQNTSLDGMAECFDGKMVQKQNRRFGSCITKHNLFARFGTVKTQTTSERHKSAAGASQELRFKADATRIDDARILRARDMERPHERLYRGRRGDGPNLKHLIGATVIWPSNNRRALA